MKKLAFGLLLATLSFGQVERASIVGAITDKSGAVVAGVEVKVTHETTNTTIPLRTDESGNYTAPNLVPGSYSITAEHAGFSRRIYRGFEVQVGQVARLDIMLEVGAVEQTVEVTGAIPLLHTEDATIGQVVVPQLIEALPQNGRNFIGLAMSAPGVAAGNFVQPGTINSGLRPDELRPGGTALQANGARSYLNQVLIDGIDATEMISQTFVVRPSIEGIQEFKVITNNAGAEVGRAGGALMVINTKSGGNNFHGSLFEFLRNSSLDAKNFFDRPNEKIPAFRQNQFGASLGGRLLRDRTFFFMDYEGQREVVGQTQVNTVPTAAMKQGDFRGAAPNGIFDPLTTTTSPLGRTRFADDRVPSSRFDPIAFKLVNLYPAPHTPGLANNYVANPTKRSATDRADLRIDHQLSRKDSLMGRYSIDDSRLTIPDTFNTDIGGREDSFAGPNPVRGHSLVVSDIHTFRTNLIADFRFGYTRFASLLTPTTLTNPVWKEIPGRDTSDPYQPSAPIISPAGYAGLGNSRSNPLIRHENMAEYIANLTWQRGSHNLKFGLDFRRRLISETASPPGESAFGRFNFDSSFANNPASPGGTGHVMAVMLLGYPARTTRDFFIPGTAYVESQEYNGYAHDEWRVNNRLTLNLGAHWEVNPPFTERNDYWVNFNPATAEVLLAGKNSSRTANIDSDWRSIGPRFGFAYQVSSKTVVRGGYGVFFAPEGRHDTTIRQFRQVPFDLIFSIIPGSLITDNLVAQGFRTLKDFPTVDPKKPFGNLKGITPDFRNGALQQFNFGVQRQVTSSSVFTAGFVGSLGRHLAWARPLNQPDPGPGNITQRRPYYSRYPDVVNISYLETSGSSAYASLQTTFEKRFSKGVYFVGNWTWAHGLDNAGGDGGANGPIPQDSRNRNADWGSMNSDVRHRVNLAWSYALPFGPGKRWAGDSGWTRHLVGDWEFAGISVLQSGLPFTVQATGSPTNTGAGTRADVVRGVTPRPSSRTLGAWFNTAAFGFPTPFNWGNAGRNILTGPPIYNFDLTLVKKFTLWERRQLIFRSEFFNAFNHPEFSLPAATIGATGVATISATQRPSRQIQFALKYAF
ncbi:MAG: carboxypeptidase regulatory-like domain-containing protein [Acidobacteria bacterium]|nr:carboxypeptidase regulatory-like domain-containing protein [Acidobacteriota bacterium]